MRERESLFNEYLIEVRRREKDEKSQRREQVRSFTRLSIAGVTIFHDCINLMYQLSIFPFCFMKKLLNCKILRIFLIDIIEIYNIKHIYKDLILYCEAVIVILSSVYDDEKYKTQFILL